MRALLSSVEATLAYAATLAHCARELDGGAPGVAELLVLAQQPEAWQNWSAELVDRHPLGCDGHSSLVMAWQFFDEVDDRASLAKEAQRLLVPVSHRRTKP